MSDQLFYGRRHAGARTSSKLRGWVAVTFLGAGPFELEGAEPKYRLFRAEAIALVRNRIMEVGCEGEAN